MPEPIYEKLIKVAEVLRFFEKYMESNAIIMLARTCKSLNINTLMELENWLDNKVEQESKEN